MPMLHRGDGQRVRVEKRPLEWCVNAMDPIFAGGILSGGCSARERASSKHASRRDLSPAGAGAVISLLPRQAWEKPQPPPRWIRRLRECRREAVANW